MKGMWRVVTGLLLFWLVILVYMSSTMFSNSDINERTERQLAKALQELDLLRKQNDELTQLAGDLKDIQAMLAKKQINGQHLQEKLESANQKLSKVNPNPQAQPIKGHDAAELREDGVAPSLEHEQLRRKVENGVKEMWYYLRSQLHHMMDTNNQEVASKVNQLLETGANHQRTILTDLYNLSMSNNHDVWRQKEAEQLSELVQRRLHYLQNPKECSLAKKLVCNMNKGCGYGCQLHHVVYCFIIAYGTQRTFVLESRGWRYSPTGWEKVFQPLSDTCNDRGGSSSRTWGHNAEDVQVVDLPIVDNINPRPPYLPQTIPKDLAPRLIRLHGHPFAWWVGQFLKYMLRPSESLAKAIEETTTKLRFDAEDGPIVGVHVRRTDKVGTEAAFHGIDEYMVYVEEYFNLRAARENINQKRIYLATDDPALLEEARKKYPDYLVISDNDFSRSASLSSRYSEGSLYSIILDIHFLSRCDYLVCTFSSQVCRVAYEIMQALHPDASDRFKSLDDVYYFGGQHGHDQIALQPNLGKRDELDLLVGDKVGIAGNHWDGYSKGRNHRTGKIGLYPSYKATEDIRIADFPTYPEAESQRNR